MKKTEKEIERAFMRKAKDALVYKFTPVSNAGVPDRLILHKGGKAEFVELKATGKKPRKLQQKVFESLESYGFPVTVISSIEEVERFWNGSL
jgi:hypothetical protein